MDSSVLKWNLLLGRILRFRGYWRWHIHTDRPPSLSILPGLRGQGLRKPGQGVFSHSPILLFWHGSLCSQAMPEPWPQTTLLPRLKRTSAIRYTEQKSAKSKLMPRSPENFALAPLSSGDGGRRRPKRKILAVMIVKQVQNGVMSSNYAGSMKQTHWEVEKNFFSVGINSETPVMLGYAFLFYYTEKKVSQSYE